ncbi:MAG: TonB-dependent receptor [Parvularculaceae bacterium]
MTKPFRAAQASSPASLIFLASLFASGSAFAETDIIIVSALRAPTLSSDVGSSVSVITAEDLKAGQFAFAADAIARTPGVALARNGGAGGAASTRLRGASSGQTLVIIDGVVVNDAAAPQGGYNFGALDTADIDRIEVLRGPQSLLYGADAIGGVIAITTRRNDPGVSAFVEGGSLKTIRGGATLAAGEGADFARATFTGFKTGGVSRASIGTEKDGFRSLTASLAGGARLNKVWRIETTARFNDTHADIDGFPPPDFTFADTAETEDARDVSVSGRAIHDAGDLSGALTLGYARLNRRDLDGGFETFAAQGRRMTADYIGVYTVSSALRLFGGAEVERTRAIVSGIDETATQGAGFVMAEVKPHERLTLSAGVRHDEYSGVKSATTARFAAAYNTGANTTLRGSYGSGFRAPSLFERYFDQYGVMPNPDLKPEKARGADLGVEHRFGTDTQHHIAVTLFHQHVEDQIDFDFAGNGYFNIDETRSRGVEAEAALALNGWLRVSGGYTFTDAIDKGTGAALPRVPKHSGVITLDAAPAQRLSFSASLLLNGRETDVPAPNDGFIRLDLRAAYALTDKLELFGRVENATDSDYEDVSGYGEPGAAVYGGLRARL